MPPGTSPSLTNLAEECATGRHPRRPRRLLDSSSPSARVSIRRGLSPILSLVIGLYWTGATGGRGARRCSLRRRRVATNWRVIGQVIASIAAFFKGEASEPFGGAEGRRGLLARRHYLGRLALFFSSNRNALFPAKARVLSQRIGVSGTVASAGARGLWGCCEFGAFERAGAATAARAVGAPQDRRTVR